MEDFGLEERGLSCVDELGGDGLILEDDEGEDDDWNDDEGTEDIGSGSGSGGWRASSSANASALFGCNLRTARRSISPSKSYVPDST